MNPDQGTELRSGRIIHSSSETSSPINPDMAQSSANDSDNNETSDISSQLSEIRENYEKKINELQSEFSQLKNLLMAVISKNDENNLPSTSQSSSKPAHTVGLDKCEPGVLTARHRWYRRHQVSDRDRDELGLKIHDRSKKSKIRKLQKYKTATTNTNREKLICLKF